MTNGADTTVTRKDRLLIYELYKITIISRLIMDAIKRENFFDSFFMQVL